jgi:hypothetical protein
MGGAKGRWQVQCATDGRSIVSLPDPPHNRLFDPSVWRCFVSRPALGLSLLLLAAACGRESPTGVDLGSHQPEGPLYRSGGSVGAGGLLIVAGPGTGASSGWTRGMG